MTAGAALATGALAAAALAPVSAQSASSPDPLEGVVTPVIEALGGATWEPLPEVAARARAAVEDAGAMNAVAYGDAAMGCFALVLRVDGSGEALHRALPEALAQQETPWTVSDWTVTGDRSGARSGFAFAGETLNGQVSVISRAPQQHTGSAPPAGDSVLTACFYDAREPARSARLCRRLLPAIEDAMHTIPEPLP